MTVHHTYEVPIKLMLQKTSVQKANGRIEIKWSGLT